MGEIVNLPKVGAAAAEYPAGLIHRNERGVPAMPQRVLIDGAWIDGRTVRPVPATLPSLPSIKIQKSQCHLISDIPPARVPAAARETRA